MKRDVIPVQVRGILPAHSGFAVFLGNDDKVFVIQVERTMGEIINLALEGEQTERPLTHHLVGLIFQGFGIQIDRIVITELKAATYFARLYLRQENELGQKLLEVDARPSDCLALACAQRRPIFVARRLFEKVEDMSELLSQIQEDPGDPPLDSSGEDADK